MRYTMACAGSKMTKDQKKEINAACKSLRDFLYTTLRQGGRFTWDMEYGVLDSSLIPFELLCRQDTPAYDGSVTYTIKVKPGRR